MNGRMIVYRGTACRAPIKHGWIIANYQDTVDMIWHYYKRINVYVVKMFGDLKPELVCDFTHV
jgi:hypothetical protein